jgi:RluA family pseudouridine synthase
LEIFDWRFEITDEKRSRAFQSKISNQKSKIFLSSMPSALDILHEDDQLVAVNKPAGLASIPGRGEKGSVLEALAGQLKLPCSGGGDPRLRVVHRLDKGTSGVLLLAKNRSAQRFLCEQFQNHTAAKEYLAIVSGRPGQSAGEIDAPLMRHPTSPQRMAIGKQGRPARTRWRLEQPLGPLSLLRVFPQTGKTHQIRVHLQSIGLPLAIDPLYNPKAAPGGLFLSQFKRDYRPTRGQPEHPLIHRLTLHAEKLTLIHPNGQTMSFIAPPPKDFRATVKQLSRHGRKG